MADVWVNDRDLADLARQAADLLDHSASVVVEALNGGGRNASWGGLSREPGVPRRVRVRLAPGNECILGVNPGWSSISVLANLIAELAGACGHQFRGRWFPNCPGHEHPAGISTGDESVRLTCPETGLLVADLTPLTG